MSIPSGVIMIWTGTNATVPSGWSRESDLDEKHPKAWGAENPDTTGGTDTHSHTSDAHTHTMASHSHYVYTNYAGNQSNDSDSDGSELCHDHTHSFPVAGVTGGSLSSVTSTYGSFSNEPPYYSVIFIKSGGYRLIPQNAVCYFNSATLPTNYLICDGTNSTPALSNKYLRGAKAGNDAGSTDGSTTNIHTLTHTHTESSHYHSQSVNGYLSDGGHRGQSGSGHVYLSHSHSVTLSSTSAGTISNPTALTTAETVEPAYKKMIAIQNTSLPSLPKGVIGLWLGTVASVPVGWAICDGTNGTPDLTDKFIKVAANTGELGNTGGSNTHTHAAQVHSHTGASHTHSDNGSDLNHYEWQAGVGGGTAVMNQGAFPHSITSVSSTAVTWNNTNTTANSSDNQPAYRTVVYIQQQFSADANLLLNFM